MSIVTYRTTVLSLHYLNYIVVEVPPVILEQLPGKFEKGNFNQRLIITLDNKISWQCGILAMGEGSGCVSVNAQRLKKIGKTVGDEVDVSFEKDESEYGVEVAEEITVLWEQDPEAFRRFSNLNPGMQRYILNHVSTAKTHEKRLERTVLLFRNLLRLREGQETFRAILGKD